MLIEKSLQSLSQLNYSGLFHASIILGIGFLLARLVSSSLTRLFEKRWSAHQLFIWRRTSFHGVLALFIISAMRELGFDLQVLLGAAGIFTVALGFASQTSASNLISGIFLISERAFAVGDTIVVNGIEGEVLSIDLLSVKLKRTDNTYVRIPNEVLIKTLVVNNTRFPNRRVDLIFTLAPQADFEQIKNMLFDLAAKNKLCLTNPKPLWKIEGFVEGGVEIKFCAWAKQANCQDLKTKLQEDIVAAFIMQKISFAYPHRIIHQVNTA